MHRTRTGAELPWYHLALPRPCRHGLACRGKTGLRAVTGAPGGGLAARRFTPTAQRPSSTPCSPARFHPSGFLSGAGGAYSPRQGCSLSAKGAHDPLVPIIIRKNGGFVNSPGKVFCKMAFDSVCVYKRDSYYQKDTVRNCYPILCLHGFTRKRLPILAESRKQSPKGALGALLAGN